MICPTRPPVSGGVGVPAAPDALASVEPRGNTNLTVISYGGGVQSTALCVLATQGVLGVDVAVFANVGDRAENPQTLAYLTRFIPWAAERGLEVVERRWVDRTGKVRDLYDDTMSETRRSIDIPVWMAGGAPGNRKCTGNYKIAVVGRELKARGATSASPATVMVGISTDEYQRANRRHAQPWEIPTYPLLELGMSRQDCANLIERAGLPVPPKSSCWFCPLQGARGWAKKRRDDPDTFAAGVVLEDRINETRVRLGRDRVSLAVGGQPLADLPAAEPALFGDEAFNGGGCDEGYCWT